MSTSYDDLDALIYVFSTLRHMREHAPTAMTKPHAMKRNHLNLLNDIALLLVTKARGDVAAVTLRQTSNSITFYYAKNHPCENSLSDYLSSIKRIIATKNHLGEMQAALQFKIINFCVEKWRSRVKKAKKELEVCGTLTIAKDHQDQTKPLSTHLLRWKDKSPQIVKK